jgi:DnaJ-class molecular chaperone with C-terminal Zn finger domain
MGWFEKADTLDGLRKLYKKLAVKYHPDNGGSEETIKGINAEYDMLFQKLKAGFEQSESYGQATDRQKQSYDPVKDERIREMVCQLSKYQGLTIELCGVWLWVSGNTKEHKDELHRLGLHYARNKQRWYIHWDDFVKHGRKPCSMSYIRGKYGSMIMHTGSGEKRQING